MIDYLHTKERADKRECTGVPGIAVLRSACDKRKDGRVQCYFVVTMRNWRGGKLRRRHCLDTLGKQEAWRRALRDRAEHERTIAKIRAQIAAERTERGGGPTATATPEAARLSRRGVCGSKPAKNQAQAV